MKQLSRVLAIFLTLSTLSTAHASWGVIGGANFYNYQDSGSDTKADLAAGLAFESWLSPGLSLELDAMYVKNTNNNSTYDALHVPILARLNLLPMFSLGGGLYAQYGFEGYGRKDLTMGAVASARISIPFGLTSLFVEGRYIHGLSAQFSSGPLKQRGIQLLAGLMF